MADADIEILTEHFGYPPVSLLDDIINAINILAESALMSIEQGLLRSPPTALGFRPPKKSKKKDVAADAPPQQSMEDMAKFEIDNGTHQLETLLCSSIDRNFDIFELYVMRNILCLRPDDRLWIRLRHYEALDFSGRNIDKATPEAVATLRKKVKVSHRLTARLESEKAQNDILLQTLRSLVSRVKQDPDCPSQTPLAFLSNTTALNSSSTETPLTTTASFALSQLPALRSLSKSLQSLSGDLTPLDAVPETPSRRTWRKSRVEYVEQGARKHLERVRGLELGEQGEVRDGEWQGEGRVIRRGEVMEVENLVGLVGGVLEGESTGKSTADTEAATESS